MRNTFPQSQCSFEIFGDDTSTFKRSETQKWQIIIYLRVSERQLRKERTSFTIQCVWYLQLNTGDGKINRAKKNPPPVCSPISQTWTQCTNMATRIIEGTEKGGIASFPHQKARQLNTSSWGKRAIPNSSSSPLYLLSSQKMVLVGW